MFQFTRPQGARQYGYKIYDFIKGFNSRAHRGRDKGYFYAAYSTTSFNSRAHRGRD